MEIAILTTLLLLGVLCGLAEIFLIPGFTVMGILGIILYGSGAFYAFTVFEPVSAYIAVGSSALGFVLLFFFLLKSKWFDGIGLKKQIDSTVPSIEKEHLQVGQIGKAMTRLNPIGKAIFGEVEVEAKSTLEFIEEGSEIEIIEVRATNVLVRKRS